MSGATTHLSRITSHPLLPVTPHEIKPKQLRALLLLLVLVPLIPTVLMIRFVIDAVQSGREAEVEKLNASYQQTLSQADAAFARHLVGRATPITAPEVHDFYRGLLDREVIIRVIGMDGVPLTGWSVPPGAPLAQSALREFGVPMQVQLFLLDPSELQARVKEHIKVYARTVVIAVIAIFSIATLAAVTVSRQLALHELKTTSVATVAHEFRTPLASMLMLVDTLREGRYRGEEQLGQYLDLIANETGRLSRLTDSFLTLSRLEQNDHAFTRESVAPRKVAERAAEALRGKLAAPDVSFTLDVADALPEIHADADAIVTVLTNLLENSLKYSDGEKQIALLVRHERESVIFSVSDNGIGLSRSERRHIFEPFFQADHRLARAREGCGLGLSIVKHIVAAHGGQVAVTSEAGEGSTFRVLLPAASNRLT